MFSANRIMSDYLVDIADVSTYGCDPMSFEELREEFEVFPTRNEHVEDRFNI